MWCPWLGEPIYPVHCRRCHATWYPELTHQSPPLAQVSLQHPCPTPRARRPTPCDACAILAAQDALAALWPAPEASPADLVRPVPDLGAPLYPVHCRHCHYTGYPRRPGLPCTCPICQRRDWSQPPVIEPWWKKRAPKPWKLVACPICKQLAQLEWLLPRTSQPPKPWARWW